MKFLLPWLLWRRAADKQQEKVDKVVGELANNKVIAELAERDPVVKKALEDLMRDD